MSDQVPVIKTSGQLRTYLASMMVRVGEGEATPEEIEQALATGERCNAQADGSALALAARRLAEVADAIAGRAGGDDAK